MEDLQTFRLRERGLGRVLGGLEAAIMEILWDGGPLAIAEVQAALTPRQLAFNTVMTVLNRLAAKGLVRREQGGRRSFYSPTRSREAFLADLTRDVAGGLVRDFGDYAVVQFVEALEREDPARLAELEALLQARRARNKDEVVD